MATAPDNLAERNAHIPTTEIEQDILDTEREIVQMELEAQHLAATPDSMREARWDHMRAEARRSGIRERNEFIRKLKEILAARKPTVGDSCGDAHPAVVSKGGNRDEE
jgi:hypothetical protein